MSIFTKYINFIMSNNFAWFLFSFLILQVFFCLIRLIFGTSCLSKDKSSDKDISESSDLLCTDTHSHYVRNVEDNYSR